jgi:fructose-specific phosphotransferase system IIA component
MNLRKLIRPEYVTTSLSGTTKEEIIRNLVEIAARSGKVKDFDQAFRSVIDRERKMSTGLKYGIAIPHGKTDAVDDLVACIAIRKDGVDFESLDGEPSRIFIMTLSPSSRSGPHLQFLAEVSKLLENERDRKSLLEARTPEEIVSVFTGAAV